MSPNSCFQDLSDPVWNPLCVSVPVEGTVYTVTCTVDTWRVPEGTLCSRPRRSQEKARGSAALVRSTLLHHLPRVRPPHCQGFVRDGAMSHILFPLGSAEQHSAQAKADRILHSWVSSSSWQNPWAQATRVQRPGAITLVWKCEAPLVA